MKKELVNRIVQNIKRVKMFPLIPENLEDLNNQIQSKEVRHKFNKIPESLEGIEALLIRWKIQDNIFKKAAKDPDNEIDYNLSIANMYSVSMYSTSGMQREQIEALRKLEDIELAKTMHLDSLWMIDFMEDLLCSMSLTKNQIKKWLKETVSDRMKKEYKDELNELFLKVVNKIKK